MNWHEIYDVVVGSIAVGSFLALGTVVVTLASHKRRMP